MIMASSLTLKLIDFAMRAPSTPTATAAKSTVAEETSNSRIRSAIPNPSNIDGNTKLSIAIRYSLALFTTPGKIIFNEILPDSFAYLNEPSETNLINKTPEKYFMERNVSLSAFNEFVTNNGELQDLTHPEKRPLVRPFPKKFLSMI